MSKYSEAQKRATIKWMKENYDSIRLTVKKGRKQVWKDEAEKREMSLNAFIRQCVEEHISEE